MYTDTQRTLWFEQLKTTLCKSFGFPDNGERVVESYPSAGARGALERVRPADYDEQWRDDTGQKQGTYRIHPMSLRTPLDAAKATLWAMARFHKGVRHGQSAVGLHKEPDATISANPDTEAKLQAVLAEIGDPPPGFAEPFPVKQRGQRGRMVTFACHCSGGKVYRTGTKLPSGQAFDAVCRHCNAPFLQV